MIHGLGTKFGWLDGRLHRRHQSGNRRDLESSTRRHRRRNQAM